MKRLTELAGPVSAELGFVEQLELRGLGGDERFCLARSGANFRLEVVCWLYKRKPVRTLMVDFVGSPMDPPTLTRLGLEGNCLAENLFQAQISLLKRDPKAILPASIELGDPEAWPVALDRVFDEVRSVQQDLWIRMSEKWTRLTGRPAR